MTLSCGLCTGQTRCLPIETYAQLVHDAYRSRVQDSLISELESRVELSELAHANTIQVYNRITGNLEAQIELVQMQQREQQAISEAWRRQARKRQRESRWLKAAVVAGFVAGFFLGSQ